MAIERLMLVDEVDQSASFAVSINGQDYRVLAAGLLAFVQAGIVIPEFTGVQQFTTQYAAPSATGFSVQITNGPDNIHLILTPTAGFAAGTLVLPGVAVAVDKQEVLVNTTQAVTTLTANGNGAVAVTGAPTTLAANAFFRLKYDAITQTWYRVG